MSSAMIRADGGQPDRDLEPITPVQAIEMYLAERQPEVSEKTLTNQRYRLTRFQEWCADNDITDLTTLTGRDLHEYRTHRSNHVKPVTLRGELQTLRVFLEFVANIDGCQPGLREQVRLPPIDPEDEARDNKVETDTAHQVLDWLNQFHYASRDHVIFAILWHTGIRLGSLRAFDLEDYDPNNASFTLRHRPDTGTPLKNGTAAERMIAVSDHYTEVIDDYIDYNRIDTTDEYGRRPLITSDQGRYSAGAIRNSVNYLTQPCNWTECPHDRDPDVCEWRSRNRALECPSAESPHSVRRGMLTHSLRTGTPERVVEDRANVTEDVLDQHYDKRTERERMEQRRDYLEDDHP